MSWDLENGKWDGGGRGRGKRWARAQVFLVGVLLGFLAVMGSGCRSPRPNILLVTFDTTRWDHVGFEGGREGVTPMLDAMAARGTWFSTCITSQPLTLPAHTTIMTGLYPLHHGVRNNGTYVVPERVTTLAERLRGLGYQTHAVVAAYVLDSQFGLDQGFDSYDDDLSGGPKQKMFMFKEIPAAHVTIKAARWLRNTWRQDRPFFLWLHYFDPHADYEPPSDVAARFPGDPYSGEIHYADRELGRVFKELDLMHVLDDTLFIFTSDHGDSLGDHGERTHGLFIYDATTRVPLLLAGPGIPRHGRVDRLVRTVDIVPTVLELLHVPVPGNLDGRSLISTWEGRDQDRIAYVETMMPRLNFGWSELRALRTARYKAIDAPRPELYDLERDPGENLNRLLVDGAGADVEGLFGRLREFEENDPFNHGGHRQADLGDETRRKLSALGYVWSSADSGDEGSLPDPKDRLQFWERFQAGQNLMRARDYAGAVALISGLLKEDPANVVARSSLARALSEIGEKDRALKVYRELIELDPDRETAYLGAARILREQNRYDEAEALIRRVLERKPEDPDGYVAMGDLFLSRESYDEAETWFRKALEVDEHSSLAAGGLGNCLNRAGRLQEAARVLQDALKRDPTSHTVTYNLAVVTERLGDSTTALELYQRAIRLEPEDAMSWNNLGSLLNRLGRADEALRFVRKAHELDRDNVEATFNLGVLLLGRGDVTSALPLLQEAAQKRPDMLRARVLAAQALEKAGKQMDALAAWQALGDQVPAAWLHIARIRLERGSQDQALEALKQGVAMDGDRFLDAARRYKDLAELIENM